MATEPPRPSLRQRFPRYLVFFGAGLGLGAAVGLIVGAVAPPGPVEAIGLVYSGLGALVLLVGGARGSGYGGGSTGSPGTEAEAAARRPDLLERRRRRLSRPPDPLDFWLVVAGVAYLALGIAVISLAGG